MISATTLADSFGVEASDVEAWIAEGMPAENIESASDWLVANGYAETPEQQIQTRSQLAVALGVSVVTADTYKAKPGFPPGPPWSVSAVMRWKEGKDGDKKSASSSKEELDRIKLETAKLKLQQQQGEVITLDVVIEEMTRQNILARQKFRTIIHDLMSLLPADTDPVMKSDFRLRARKKMDDAFDDLANAFRRGTQ